MENEILHLLQKGKANAITAAALAKTLDQKDDRRIRLSILKLIKEGYPVVSSVIDPKGYFLAENYEEAMEYQEALLKRIRGDAFRLKYFKVAVKKHVPPRQGVLIT